MTSPKLTAGSSSEIGLILDEAPAMPFRSQRDALVIAPLLELSRTSWPQSTYNRILNCSPTLIYTTRPTTFPPEATSKPRTRQAIVDDIVAKAELRLLHRLQWPSHR
jgi:hypothetical protein